MWKWAKEAHAGRKKQQQQQSQSAPSESSGTPRNSSRIIIQPTPCLSNAQYSLCRSRCVFVVIFLLFCFGFCVYVRERKLGRGAAKSFLLESRFLPLTDRYGTMKANHDVPQTSKVPVFLRLLATTRNNLSPDVDSSKKMGRDGARRRR